MTMTPIRRVSSRTQVTEEARQAQLEAEQLEAEQKRKQEENESEPDEPLPEVPRLAVKEERVPDTTGRVALSYPERNSAFSSQILKGLAQSFQDLVDEIGPNKTAVLTRVIASYLTRAGVDLSQEPLPIPSSVIAERRRSSIPLRERYYPFSCPMERRIKAHLDRFVYDHKVSKIAVFNQAVHDLLIENNIPPEILPPRHL